MQTLSKAALLGALLVAVRAAAFVPANPTSVTQSPRWTAIFTPVAGNASLHDGLSVAIEPGLAETLIGKAEA